METQQSRPNLFGRIIRSKVFLYNIIAIAVFAIISWIYFYPDIIEGNVLKQHDVQQGIAIGNEGKEFFEETGETTRWTNSLFSGMPNFQISPSYESTKLINVIGKAYSLWLPAPVSFLFIMMLGFYILLLSLKIRWYIAIPGAIAYAFSSYFFIIIGAGHIWKYVTLAYIPPTIAGIIWCYRGKYLAGGTVAALFASLQITSNHVQMSYYFIIVIIALSVAFLFINIKKNRIKEWFYSTGVLIIAAILAVAANSPNLYNTYEYSKESMRGGHSELATPGENAKNTTGNGLNKDYITQWSYGIDETFSLLIPNIKGGATIKPEKGNNVFLSLAETEKAKEMLNNNEISGETFQYLQNFPQYFGDQPMTNGPVYVGALIMVLFIVGCFAVKGPVKWALLCTTVLSIMLAWGHNFMWFTDLFIDYVPMYNKFRTVSSILVIAEFTIPLLAIITLQKLITDKNFYTANSKIIYISFGVMALLCIIAYIAPGTFGSAFSEMEQDQYIKGGIAQQVPELFKSVETIRMHMISADAMRSLMIILISFVTIFIYSTGKLKPAATCIILAVIILVDLYTVNKRYLNSDSFVSVPLISQPLFTPRPVDKQIKADTAMNYRVLDIPNFGDATPSYFHKTIGGYHAAKLARYQDLIDHQIMNNNMDVLNMLNTKYIITDDTTAHINPGALGNAWFVNNINYVNTPTEEMNGLTDFNPAEEAVADVKFKGILGEIRYPKSKGDTIFETKYAPNELHYHAKTQNGGLAVFSEIYFPWGWHATIDGKDVEIGRVNYVLRAIRIPAGEHTVVFRFDPKSVKITENIAYASIIIIYICLILVIFGVGTGNKQKIKE